MTTHEAFQQSRFGAVLAQAAKDEAARRERASRPDPYERVILARYVQQQVAAGAFEALMLRAKRAERDNNPYNLGIKHFEVLDMACGTPYFGQGNGQRGVFSRLLDCGLIKPIGGGCYAITEAGRRYAAGQADQ